MKKILLLMMGILFLTVVSGAVPDEYGLTEDISFVFEQGENITLRFSCFDINNTFCSDTTPCNITILYPDETLVVDNQQATWEGSTYSYNLTGNQLDTLGTYSNIVTCEGNSTNGFATFNFLITPNGQVPTTSKGMMYLGLLAIFIIFFAFALYGGKQAESIVGKSAFFLTSYLILIGISFISWNLALDYLTSAPFIASFFRIFFLFLLYAFFPLLIILTFYTMWMMKKIDAIQKMIDKGIPEDEAYGRTVKGGLAGSKKW